MLRGIKKLVGPKTDDELQIQRYRGILEERSEPSPEIHLKIGRLHEKIGEKADASLAYKEAAKLYMERKEYVGALVANKLIVRIDRDDADALANVAFIELQQGITLSQQEFTIFLQDIGQPLRSSVKDENSGDTKRSSSRLALSRNNKRRQREQDNPKFQSDRQQLLGLITGDAEVEERFDASFDVNRHSLLAAIREGDDAEPVREAQPVAPEESHQGDSIDDMPFLDLSQHVTPGDRIAPAVDTDEVLNQIGQCSLFSRLSEATLEELQQKALLREICEGMAVPPLHAPQCLSVVLQGTVEVTLEGAGSQPVRLLSGDFWGEHDFLGQTDVTFSAVAKTPATIADIPKTILAPIAKKHPSLLDQLKKTCKRRCFLPFLRRVAIFQELNAEEIQHVAEFLFTKDMRKGNILIREGEWDESIFLIESGKVEVRTSFVEREELQVLKTALERVHLACLQEGDFFGEGAYFTKEPRSATIVAQTNGRLLKLPGSHLKKLFSNYPRIESVLRQYHYQRIESTMEKIQAVL